MYECLDCGYWFDDQEFADNDYSCPSCCGDEWRCISPPDDDPTPDPDKIPIPNLSDC